MPIYSSNNFRVGLKIIVKEEPYAIEENEFVKPGKGQAFVRVKLRRLLTGTRVEKTFRSTDSVKIADVVETTLVYLYCDDRFFYFINKSFDQLSTDKFLIGNCAKWLVSQENYSVTLWEGKIISLTPPKFMHLKISNNSEIENGLQTKNKLVILSNGVTIKVPLFLREGEVIKVDTKSEKYVSRVKAKIR